MKILIIDDNPQITLSLSRILINKGHTVTSSNLFEKGMDVIKKDHFDVIMLDAPMPGYEKLNVISELEKNGILHSNKVILFTGLEIPTSKIVELHAKGLYSYLKKPIEVEKLIQEISSVPSLRNTELTEKRVSEQQTKQKLENLRSNLSSLKLKLSPT